MPSTDNPFLAQRSPVRARLVVLIAVVAVVVLAAVFVFSRGTRANHQTSAPAAATVASTSAAAVAAPPVVTSRGSSPLRLVEGKRRVNGVAVGYPHSPVGAVSAAVEYASQFGSTLDLQRAVAIGAAVNDPGSGRAASWFAQGPISSRQYLGLPLTGGVPVGASISEGPVEYQLRDVAPDRMTVLLLVYITTVTPAQGLRNLYAVIPCRMVWAGGDWKDSVRPAGESDFTELKFVPGSAEAEAAGWLPLSS